MSYDKLSPTMPPVPLIGTTQQKAQRAETALGGKANMVTVLEALARPVGLQPTMQFMADGGDVSFDTPPEWYAERDAQTAANLLNATLDIDPWESPANVASGVSTVNAQPFVNLVGAAPAPPVQAAPAFVGSAQAALPAEPLVPQPTQPLAPPPDTRSPLEKALGMLDSVVTAPARAYQSIVGGDMQQGQDLLRQNPQLVKLQNAAGDIGAGVGDFYDQNIRRGDTFNPLGIPEAGSSEGAGRFIAEAAFPTTYAELAAFPLLGLTPFDNGLVGAGKGLSTAANAAKTGALGYVDNAARSGLGAVPEGAVARTVAPAAPLRTSVGEAAPWVSDADMRWAALNGRQVNADTMTLYHGTTADNAARIQQEGLTSGFLTPNQSLAETFSAPNGVASPDMKRVILETRVPPGSVYPNFGGPRNADGLEIVRPLSPESVSSVTPVGRFNPSSNIPRGISPTEGFGIMRTGGAADADLMKQLQASLNIAKKQGPEAAMAAAPKIDATTYEGARTAFNRMSNAQLKAQAARAGVEPVLTPVTKAVDRNATIDAILKNSNYDVPAPYRAASSEAPVGALSADTAPSPAQGVASDDAALDEDVARGLAAREGAGNMSAGLPVKMPENLGEWTHDAIKSWDLKRVGNEARQATAGLDVSNALRQGWGTVRHGVEYVDSVKTAGRALHDEEFALATNAALKEGKGAKAGLFIGDIPGEGVANLTKREENYAAELIGNLPGYKQTGRANTLFLNKQRDGVFNVVDQAWARAEEAATRGDAGPLQKASNWLARDGDREALANYINRTTGRGTLGVFEDTGVSDLLGFGFFSPRYQASRFQGPLQMFNIQHPRVAIEAIKDYGAAFAATVSLLALANESGLAEVNLNPLATDFGKFRAFNTRIDPWAGYQGLARLTARLLAGEYENGFDVGAGELVSDFIRGKLSPLAGRTVDVTGAWPYAEKGKDIIGRDVTPQRIAEGFLPIFAQGLLEASRDGLLGEALASLPASTFGLGVSVYEDSPSQQREKAAKAEFDASYRDLDIVDQAALNAKLIAEGKQLTDWQRAGPYFGADDKVFKNLQATEPALQGYADLNAFRDDLTKRLSGKGLLPQDVDQLRQEIEASLGLTTKATQAERLKVVAKDPGIVAAMQKLYEAGELTYPPAKYLREFVAALEQMQAVPAR